MCESLLALVTSTVNYSVQKDMSANLTFFFYLSMYVQDISRFFEVIIQGQVFLTLVSFAKCYAKSSISQPCFSKH